MPRSNSSEENLSFAMPAMQADLGMTKADLGLFFTLHGLPYGLSRFVNGIWADRSTAGMSGLAQSWPSVRSAR